MLNYKHLHYFASIASSGGVTRAAKRLHLTFLISAERRLTHPAAQAVSENAHSECSRRRSLPGEADGAGSVIARYAGGDFFQCCPGSCSLVGAGCPELRPLDLRCSAALASR
jgi:hypothetical protein